MPTIGQIVVDLQAQNATFLIGVKECQASLRNLENSAKANQAAMEGMNRAMDIVGSAAMGFLGAFSVERLAGFVEAQIDVIDHSDRMAQALGAPVDIIEGLGSAAFVKAGIEADAFNGDLERMTKNIADLAIKGGSAEKMLEKFGINANQLHGLRVDEQFLAIAEAISKISNRSDAAAASVALFGRSGAELLPVFEGGAAAIERSVEDARSMGTALGEIDSKNVAQAAEQIREMEEAFKGLSNEIISDIAPVLAEFFKEAIKDIRFVKDQLSGHTAANDLAAESDDLYKGLDANYQQLQSLRHDAYKLFTKGQDVSSVIAPDAAASPEKQLADQRALQGVLQERAKLEEQMLEVHLKQHGASSALIKNNQAGLKVFQDATAAAGANADKLEAKIKGQAAAQKGAAKEAAKNDRELDAALGTLLEHSLTPEEKLGQTIGTLNAGLAAGKISWDQYAEAAKHAMDEAAKNAEEAARAQKEASGKAEHAAEEVDPALKYRRELAEYQDMLNQKLISKEDYDKLAAKAGGELSHSLRRSESMHTDDLNQKATSENWNSRLRIGDTNVKDETSKRQLEENKKQTFYQGEMYRFQRDQHDKAASGIVDF